MKNIAFVILALWSLSLSGCATNSIPPEKQKDYALVKAGEFTKSFLDGRATIYKIDDASVLDMMNSGRDVLPGKHIVKVNSCVRSNCSEYIYAFEAKAGLAYILKPREIEVVDRFDYKKNVDTLKQILFTNATAPYYTSDELKQFYAENAKQAEEAKKRESEAAAAAQAVIIEKRTKNLPLVKKIGTRICQEKTESEKRPGYSNPFVYVYVGYVESMTEDKVQIRISDAYLKGSMPSQKSRPNGFSPSIIWDSPMNWDLCE